jgi:pilus assembly protein CpaD
MRPMIVHLSALAGVALTWIGGCTPESERLGVYDQPKQIMVTKSQANYVAYVDADTGDMSAQERQRTMATLSAFGPMNSLTVSIRADGSPAQMQRLSQSLMATGIVRDRIFIVSGGAVYPGLPGAPPVSPDPRLKAVTLAVEYFTAVVPGCPDWRRANLNDGSNAYSSNFGCANMTNFSRMIVNPGDLVGGVPSGRADGSRAADAVQAYHDGKLRLPPSVDRPFVMPSGREGP